MKRCDRRAAVAATLPRCATAVAAGSQRACVPIRAARSTSSILTLSTSLALLVAAACGGVPGPAADGVDPEDVVAVARGVVARPGETMTYRVELHGIDVARPRSSTPGPPTSARWRRCGSSVRLRRDGADDPASERRGFTLWISDDVDRVPLRLRARTDYGDVEMALVDYRAE